MMNTYSVSIRPILVAMTVGGAALLPLTDGSYAVIDADDYDRCKHYRWYRHRLGYAAANTARDGILCITTLGSLRYRRS